MRRPPSSLLALGVVTFALACAPRREAPSTSPSTDDEASPPAVRTEFVSEHDDHSIPDAGDTTDDAPPKAKPDAPKPDAPKPDAPKENTSAAPPEQEGTAPSPDGTQPEAGAPPPSPTHG